MNPCLVDVISAIKLATLCVAKSPTKFRLLACGFALEIGHYQVLSSSRSLLIALLQKFFRSAEVAEVEELLRKMRAIITLNAAVRRSTDCSFLFWHRTISGIYFKSLFEDSSLLSERFNVSRRQRRKKNELDCSCTRVLSKTPLTPCGERNTRRLTS